ncbi:MAG: DUF1800 domain-containing protein [Bacteroidia bacterium]|nr:DUF1800 domain-containing protein [Bacteroidia bacterium]
MASQRKKIQHLFLRGGFSELPSVIKQKENLSLQQNVDALFSDSEKIEDLNLIPSPLEGKEDASNMRILRMIIKSREDVQKLNYHWLYRMTVTKASLREKMTFFWHNHFSTSVPFAYLMQQQNNMLRKHAMGKFSDMLRAISKDAAMLIYLNNQQNIKEAPNENFAREVMELFTLGIGHYTEQDIKEGARAFTGWRINRRGEFEMNAKQHDDGDKIFLGKKGNFNGDDIITFLLEQKKTAQFIITKIYREFINEKINQKHVEELADVFYNSCYDIKKLMQMIFSSDWFYDEENIGAKIISPTELIVRFSKLVNMEFEKEEALLGLQKILGQILFFPPNVAGWKGGMSWIDSASLLARLNLPQLIQSGTSDEFRPKPEFEDAPLYNAMKKKQIKIKSDWSALVNSFNSVSEKNLLDEITDSLIQCDSRKINNVVVLSTDNSSRTKYVSGIIANVMSLPEF